MQSPSVATYLPRAISDSDAVDDADPDADPDPDPDPEAEDPDPEPEVEPEPELEVEAEAEDGDWDADGDEEDGDVEDSEEEEFVAEFPAASEIAAPPQSAMTGISVAKSAPRRDRISILADIPAPQLLDHNKLHGA